ncbi:MAG: polyamine ABC transporter substrate-binding protein [Oceanospirillaceae bacterium]|nr:polyamine ABC transporter substrate-binding protein [Oceanospirillaceae bacterium]
MLSKKLTTSLTSLALATGLISGAVNAQEELNLYNWSDYIAEDTIANFEAETGIKVTYDVFDSNDVLEAKLLSGNSGYDLVVPSSSFLGRQIKAGVFQTLDKSKLSNYSHLDSELMGRLTTVDPDNAHSIPYLWGTTGIGYNPEMVAAVLGDDAPLDSWDMLFKEENISKLASCGVSLLDASDEVLPVVLNYLDLDPNSLNHDDYKGPVADLMKAVRPHVTKFHSSNYINELANGDICFAVGWSGDILMAGDRAAEADNGVAVEYVIPKEGAPMWFDMLAIPADAANVDNAHKFLNYLLRPEVIAEITDYVWYANANASASAIIDADILAHPGIYPSEEAKANLFTFEVMPPKVTRTMNRVWTDIRSSN